MKHLAVSDRKKISADGRIGFAVCVLMILGADQFSKRLVLSSMALNDSIPIISGFFHLTFIYNTGASFGMFPNQATFFMVMTSLLIAALCWVAIFRKGTNRWVRMLLGLITGGALGNLTDRILRDGAVVDFIDFCGIWPYIFNVADMAVLCGCALMIILTLRDEKDRGAGKPKHLREGGKK